MDLGELVIKLKMDFGDALSQVERLVSAQEDLGSSAESVSSATAKMGDAVESIIAPIQGLVDAQLGAVEAASSWVEALNAGIDNKFSDTVGISAEAVKTLGDEVVAAGSKLDEFFSAEEKAAAAPSVAQGQIDDLGTLKDALNEAVDDYTQFAAGIQKAQDAGQIVPPEQLAQLDELKSKLDESRQALEDFTGAEQRGAGTPVVSPEAAPQLESLSEAFRTLGFKSSEAMQQTATDAKLAFDTIVESGTASIADLQKAWIAMEEAKQAATVASGNIIAEADRAALENAKAPILEIKSSTEEAGSSAKEATGSFAEMARTLMQIGEALVITEGLREFATEALNAWDSIEKVTNSLTALSGSAEKAEETLAQIESIAQRQPFSFQDLGRAAIQLEKFNIDAEKIPEILDAASNAARGTMGNVDSIATALSRVEATGAVTSRQLMMLGLSWKDLAAAMGTSIEVAQEKLKKGGQDAAADLDVVLSAMESKFGSMADLPKTFSEQMQLMENAVHTAFAEVGQALAPLIGQIVDFLTNSLVPALKSAIELFKELPEPVQQGAIVFGLLVAAIIPLTAAIAAFSMAIGAVGGLLAPVTAGLEALGIQAGATAAEVTVAAEAIEGSGAGAGLAGAAEGAAAAVGTGGLAGALGGLSSILVPFAAGIIATGANLKDLKDRLQEVADKAKTINILQYLDLGGTTEGLKKFGVSLADIKTALEGTSKEISYTKIGTDDFGNAVYSAGPKLKTLVDALHDGSQAFTDFGIKVTIAKEGLPGLSSGAQSVVDVQKKLDDAVKTASANYADLVAHYKAGTVSAADVARGLADLTKAQSAANVGAKDHAMTVATITANLAKENESSIAAQKVLADLQAKYDAAAISGEGLIKATQLLAEAHKQLDPIIKKTSESAGTWEGAEAAIIAKDKEATINARNLAMAWLDLKQKVIDGTAPVSAQVAAYKAMSSGLAAIGLDSDNLGGSLAKLGITMTTTTVPTIAMLTGGVLKLVPALVDTDSAARAASNGAGMLASVSQGSTIGFNAAAAALGGYTKLIDYSAMASKTAGESVAGYTTLNNFFTTSTTGAANSLGNFGKAMTDSTVIDRKAADGIQVFGAGVNAIIPPMREAADAAKDAGSGIEIVGQKTKDASTAFPVLAGSVNLAQARLKEAKDEYNLLMDSYRNGTTLENGKIATVKQIEQALKALTIAQHDAAAAQDQSTKATSSWTDAQIAAMRAGGMDEVTIRSLTGTVGNLSDALTTAGTAGVAAFNSLGVAANTFIDDVMRSLEATQSLDASFTQLGSDAGSASAKGGKGGGGGMSGQLGYTGTPDQMRAQYTSDMQSLESAKAWAAASGGFVEGIAEAEQRAWRDLAASIANYYAANPQTTAPQTPAASSTTTTATSTATAPAAPAPQQPTMVLYGGAQGVTLLDPSGTPLGVPGNPLPVGGTPAASGSNSLPDYIGPAWDALTGAFSTLDATMNAAATTISGSMATLAPALTSAASTTVAAFQNLGPALSESIAQTVSAAGASFQATMPAISNSALETTAPTSGPSFALTPTDAQLASQTWTPPRVLPSGQEEPLPKTYYPTGQVPLPDGSSQMNRSAPMLVPYLPQAPPLTGGPGGFLPPVSSGGSPTIINIHNPVVTNQSMLDQMVGQIRDLGMK